ncbi:unnamed protein product [Candida verbasci]|uniref:Uncharacterized protein n=1 Tax=Candida verbasci TaxID=1227364 RepID=A0A9W4TUQ6_9ASCO|nr:unnamed protein product [Candida verbasci]
MTSQVDSIENIQPSIVNNVINLSVDELNQLESKIESNFKSISSTYLNDRLIRLNCLIEKLSNSIKIANANDKSWSKIFNFEIESINNIMTNTEDLILDFNKPDLVKTLNEYQDELQDVFSNLQSPFDFDDTFKYNQHLESPHLSKLPFPSLFNQFFENHRKRIKTINNEKDYQERLIKLNSKNQSVIIWKQYYNKIIAQKHELLTSLNEELSQLYKDYNHLNEYENLRLNNQYYYRSLIPPHRVNKSINLDIHNLSTRNISQLMNTYHDSNYTNLDTRLVSRNKIELSQISQNIKKSGKFVNYIKHGIKRSIEEEAINPSKKFRINKDEGDQDALDHDIQQLRKSIDNKDFKYESSDLIESEIDSDYDSDDWEYIEEIIDEEDELSPEEKAIRKKYKSIINDKNQETTRDNSIQFKLPPLEMFPELTAVPN